MKKFTISICFALFSLLINAQTEINHTWKNQVNPIFLGLNKNYIPNGILMDYAMEFINVSAYNGVLTSSNSINANVYGNIYKTLFMGRVTSNTQHFPKLEDIANNWLIQRQNHNQTDKSTIVLAGLYYKYAQINTTALISNKITVSNNKYFDKFVNGVWQNPYLTKQTVAFTPPVNTYNKLNFGVILPQNMMLSNSFNTIQSIQINFNDGSGYKTIAINQKVIANYSQNGTYDWTFKTTLTNGEVLFSSSKIIIDAPLPIIQVPILKSQNTYANNVHINGPNGSFPLWSNGAILRIDYAPSHNGQLRKPLIVAEGFDSGSILTPERDGGDRTLNHFLNDIRFTSGNQLRTLLDFDSTQEYDIVYIDWKNGTNSIQHNSAVLRNVINWVNQKKQQANSTEPNVLLGQSMGGLIGRYTLAKMEQDNLNHDVRLFIAHDSPMQGANTPLSFQYFSRHANDQYTSAPVLYGLIEVVIPTVLNLLDLMSLGNLNIAFPSISDILTIQDTPAAMQMNYHYVDFLSNPTMAIHNAWQQEFDSVGYPTQCRNVAISNGNECAVNHGFAPRDKFLSIHDTHNPGFWGDLLHIIVTPLMGALGNDAGLIVLGVLPGSSKYFFDFDLHSNPDVNSTNRQVYWGKIRYEKKFLWLVPISHTITERTKQAPNGYLPFDTYSGGFYDFVDNISFDFQSYIPSGSVINRKYGFIPVVSALDIKRNNGNVNPSDYLKNYAGGNTPEPALASGFDNFIVDFRPNLSINNAHISFQPRNGNWLARELQEATNLIDDCSYICSNNQIIGLNTICTSSTYTAPVGGTFYNWQIVQGGHLVSMIGNGTTQVTLNRINTSNGMVRIRVTYGDNGVNCGNATLEKDIWVGLPASFPMNTVISGPTQVQSGALPTYIINSPLTQGATSFEWWLPYPYDTVPHFSNQLLLNGQNWAKLEGPASQGSQITVFSGYGDINGYMQAMVKNDCGCGDARWLYVEHGGSGGPMPIAPPPGDNNNTTYMIYPNPSSSSLNIDLRDSEFKPIAENNVKGELFDLFGQSKGITNIINNKANISVHNLNKGVYVLKIYFDDKVESHQVIVQ